MVETFEKNLHSINLFIKSVPFSTSYVSMCIYIYSMYLNGAGYSFLREYLVL